MVSISCFFLAFGCKGSKQVNAPSEGLSKAFPADDLNRLLRGVPGDAKIVGSFSMPSSIEAYVSYFLRTLEPPLAQQMEQAIDAHMTKHSMHDLRPVRAAMGYALLIDEPKFEGAFMIAGVNTRFLKTKKGDIEEGVIWRVVDDVLIIGSTNSVDASAELLAKGQTPSGPMVDAFTPLMHDAFFAIAGQRDLVPSLIGRPGMPKVLEGLDYATFRVGRKKAVANIYGQESNIAELNTIISMGLSKAVHELEMERQKTASKDIEGLFSIVALFQVKDAVKEVQPQQEGGMLTMSLSLPDESQMLAPVVLSFGLTFFSGPFRILRFFL